MNGRRISMQAPSLGRIARPAAVALLVSLAAVAFSTDAWAAKARSGRLGHWGEDQAFRIQFGELEPDGDSVYWRDTERDFLGSASDFEDFAFGIEYVRFLGPRMGVVVSGHFFEGDELLSYRDFVDELGFEIEHTTTLEISSFNLGLLYQLARRDAAIQPYIGGGGGLFIYRLDESGDFIDFFSPELDIFNAAFTAEGETFGYYFQAGVEVPLGRSWSIYADARWERAKDDLGDDLDGLGELDLSSRTISFGTSFSF